MSTTRIPAAERGHFVDMSKRRQEPAMGTLAQRLDILILRFGGRLRLERATPAERAELGL